MLWAAFNVGNARPEASIARSEGQIDAPAKSTNGVGMQNG